MSSTEIGRRVPLFLAFRGKSFEKYSVQQIVKRDNSPDTSITSQPKSSPKPKLMTDISFYERPIRKFSPNLMIKRPIFHMPKRAFYSLDRTLQDKNSEMEECKTPPKIPSKRPIDNFENIDGKEQRKLSRIATSFDLGSTITKRPLILCKNPLAITKNFSLIENNTSNPPPKEFKNIRSTESMSGECLRNLLNKNLSGPMTFDFESIKNMGILRPDQKDKSILKKRIYPNNYKEKDRVGKELGSHNDTTIMNSQSISNNEKKVRFGKNVIVRLYCDGNGIFPKKKRSREGDQSKAKL